MSTGPTANPATDTKSKAGDVTQTPFAMSLTMIAFLGIAFFNAFELIFMVIITFKRYSGLYFWSVLIAAAGIPVYCVGFTLKFFVTGVPNMNYVGLAIVILGWVPMVTGQSLALYSRLNLVLHDHRKLRWVLWMIIFNAFAFHGTTTGLAFAAEASTQMAKIYAAYEKAELMAFATQECIISGLYIVETYKVLRPTTTAQGKRITAVRRNLIYVNVIVICLDAALIGIEFANQYKIQTTFKALVYSVKLGLEFSVLNTLLRAIQGHGSSSYDTGSSPHGGGGNTYHGGRSNNTRLETFRGTQKSTSGAFAEHPSTFSNVVKGDNDGGVFPVSDAEIVKTTEVYVASSAGGDDDTDISPKDHRAGSKASSEIGLTTNNGVYHPTDWREGDR